VSVTAAADLATLLLLMLKTTLTLYLAFIHVTAVGISLQSIAADLAVSAFVADHHYTHTWKWRLTL
jgi:hypothetical protein